ncbi:DUF3299 domain-containing protein [Pseudomonas sp. RIT-PI-AD]|uniref:DUF3299 domain-containing protein n=1 Tax=Pseudomonas sp. RIT-PI-AD TaxID=3035294 RepID=UPI0021DAA289|nr:DUF3299 domain-containing protein [Pseudomonas sp. RIT-PI-AD]
MKGKGWALCLSLALALPCHSAELRELSWDELIPAGTPSRPEAQAPLHDLSQLADALAAESGPAAVQRQPDAPVVQALDGLGVKLPGYVVPLEVSEAGKATSFLLVPYFGACIHVPPPPSNQIVYVESAEGIALDALYQPFWVEGALKVEAARSELADAGYRMRATRIYPYEIPD